MTGFQFIALFTIIIPISFLYGIGLDRVMLKSASPKMLVYSLFPDGPLVFISATALWFLLHFVLLPLGLFFLFPVLFVILTAFLEELFFMLLPRFTPSRLPERGLSYGLGFFALYTASSYIEMLGLLFVGFASFLAVGLLFFTIRRRLDSGYAAYEWKTAPLLLVSLGFIGLALYALDFSWLISVLH